LYGINNPSGHLPESWISSVYQNPIYQEFLRRDIYHTYFKDDIYVGYRYYDLHQAGFILPFGYGLSYSNFKYSDFETKVENDLIRVTLSVENTSDIDGRALVQVYIGKKDSAIYRPIKELKGFNNVFVKKHMKDTLEIVIDIDDIKTYRNATDTFELEDGEYQVYIATNSKDILKVVDINLAGVKFETSQLEELPVKNVIDYYTIDSPSGVLFNNECFKQYVKEHDLPIDLEDFETKHWYIYDRPLRDLVNDRFFCFAFDELVKLVEYLNKHDTINKKINFDEYVRNNIKILEW
jgi:hypothetical protein